MSNLNVDIYDAFQSAGIDEALARKAAISVVDNDKELMEVKSTLRLHSWMLATNIALSVGSLFKLIG